MSDFMRGDIVLVFPVNDDDPEAVRETGKRFRVSRCRRTASGQTIVACTDLATGLETRVFRAQDLLGDKGQRP